MRPIGRDWPLPKTCLEQPTRLLSHLRSMGPNSIDCLRPSRRPRGSTRRPPTWWLLPLSQSVMASPRLRWQIVMRPRLNASVQWRDGSSRHCVWATPTPGRSWPVTSSAWLPSPRGLCGERVSRGRRVWQIGAAGRSLRNWPSSQGTSCWLVKLWSAWRVRRRIFAARVPCVRHAATCERLPSTLPERRDRAGRPPTSPWRSMLGDVMASRS